MSGVPLMPFGNRYLREQQGSNFFNLMRACSGRHPAPAARRRPEGLLAFARGSMHALHP